MRPKILTLCGWGPYREKERVDFTAFEEKGIFLITGATGAGKTTIFDAITYALYGALSGEERDKERGSVRSDFAEPADPTYVELDMEHGGIRYRIRRNPEYLRPKKRKGRGDACTRERENAILYYPDGRVLEGVREVNAALKELLVLDLQQFKRLSMIAQGEFARLLVAPPKEKARIFREIFDTGMYERFTQSLGARARAAYNRVSEQKHKLEEDVRLLMEGLEESGWSREAKDALGELSAAENRNYPAIAALLGQLGQEARRNAEEYRAAYEKGDKQLEELTAELTRLQEENERILQLKRVSDERRQLEGLASEQEAAQRRYTRAVNAVEVQKEEERGRGLERQLALCQAERQHMEEEREQLQKEAAGLRAVAENAEQIRSLLELRSAMEEEKRIYGSLKGQLESKRKQLMAGQGAYLEQEKDYNCKRADYEGAERERRMNVIGLAAGQLRDGEPCPVCGSLHHPSPAQADFRDVSEETLAEIKKNMEEAYAGLMELHEQSVALKTQTEGLEGQLLMSEEKQREMEKRLVSFQAEVYEEFCGLSLEEASARLQEKCGRASELSGLLQEKDSSLERLTEKAGVLQEEIEAEKAALEEALSRYGFQGVGDYEAARLPAEQREELHCSIEAYKLRVAANRELYSHLEGTVSVREPSDLTGKTRALNRLREEREDSLKGQKLWDRQLSEVKRVSSLMERKLAVIEKESREYGFIRDLENMASGNNARRLVFEQYVLAGYFEEILRAANLRFARMSGGRYEMSRVEQVGDGRVKDNLEIQVLDYYTGKYRSVRTLSGGESFKAALALALGMSDVIQAMNGGIRVDTLFVDEGFGALDPESLDQACDALMGLSGKKQLIGIISHVPELRERIPDQLVIEKTGSGSRLVH